MIFIISIIWLYFFKNSSFGEYEILKDRHENTWLKKERSLLQLEEADEMFYSTVQ